MDKEQVRDDTWIVRTNNPIDYSQLGNWIPPYREFNVNRLRIFTIGGSLAVL